MLKVTPFSIDRDLFKLNILEKVIISLNPLPINLINIPGINNTVEIIIVVIWFLVKDDRLSIIIVMQITPINLNISLHT